MFYVTLATIATTISSLATEVNLKRIGTYHASSKLKKHHNISTPLTDLSLGVLTFFVLHMEQKIRGIYHQIFSCPVFKPRR